MLLPFNYTDNIIDIIVLYFSFYFQKLCLYTIHFICSFFLLQLRINDHLFLTQ